MSDASSPTDAPPTTEKPPAADAPPAGRAGASPGADVPEVVVAAWRRCEAAWDDRAAHDALIGLVAQHRCFAWAAARYREGAGDPVAAAQLERLQRAATATLMATATGRRKDDARPYRATLTVLTMLVIVLVLGLFYVLVLHARHAVPPTTRPG